MLCTYGHGGCVRYRQQELLNARCSPVAAACPRLPSKFGRLALASAATWQAASVLPLPSLIVVPLTQPRETLYLNGNTGKARLPLVWTDVVGWLLLLAGWDGGAPCSRAFGRLSINHFVASLAEMPFGGVKDSGYAREGGSEGLTHYTVVKNVSHLTA
jgi:hypothetical protein